MATALCSWLRRSASPGTLAKSPRRRRPQAYLGVEVLEERANPSPIVITGGFDQSFTEGRYDSAEISAKATRGDQPTLTITGLPPGLTLQPDSTSTFLDIYGKPAAGSVGRYPVKVTASTSSATATSAFTWTILPAPAPQVMAIPNQVSSLGQQIPLVGLVPTSNVDSFEPVSFSATGLPLSLVVNTMVDGSAGTISGYLLPGTTGKYRVTVTAQNASHASGSTQFTWTVGPVVSSPLQIQDRASSDGAPTDHVSEEGFFVDEGDEFHVTDSAGTATLSAIGLPPGLSMNASGRITGTPTRNSAGSYDVHLFASDGTNTFTLGFTWIIKNIDTVSVTAPADQTNIAGDVLTTLAVQATSDLGYPLTYQAYGLPDGLKIDQNGVVSGTIGSKAPGTYSVIVVASDGEQSASANFKWTVEDQKLPTIQNPGPQVNTPGVAIDLKIKATSADGQTSLPIAVQGLPPGLVDKTAEGAAGAEIRNSGSPESPGIYLVTLTTADGFDTSSTSFSWTISPGNQIGTAGRTLAPLHLRGSNAAGDPLTFSATGLPPGLTISKDGVISGAISASAKVGNHPVTVSATDGTHTGTASFDFVVLPNVFGGVFQDFNANGDQDPGEPALAGYTVFLDLNNNGVLDPGEPTALSNAQGDYSFTSLPATPSVARLLLPGPTVQLTEGANGYLLDPSHLDTTDLHFGVLISSPVTTLSPTPHLYGSTPNPDADTAFVRGLYEAILGRDPAGTPGDVAWEGQSWVDQLHVGLSRLAVAEAIGNSTEHRGLEVDAFYRDFLGRTADAAGRSYWIDRLQAGDSEASVTLAFLNSAEFQAAHADGADYVQALYRNVLGRSASDSEAAGWRTSLAGGLSRADLAAIVVNSQEAANLAISGYYAAFLHRGVDDQAGGWSAALQQGSATPSDVAAAILASDEFYANSRVTVVAR